FNGLPPVMNKTCRAFRSSPRSLVHPTHSATRRVRESPAALGFPPLAFHSRLHARTPFQTAGSTTSAPSVPLPPWFHPASPTVGRNLASLRPGFGSPPPDFQLGHPASMQLPNNRLYVAARLDHKPRHDAPRSRQYWSIVLCRSQHPARFCGSLRRDE